MSQPAGLFCVETPPYACLLGTHPHKAGENVTVSSFALATGPGSQGSPQSLLSNLKADPCVLKDLLLKEYFSHVKFWNVSCPLFTCCYTCRLLPVSDVFLCFLCVAGSIVYLGMMVGAFFWGGLADKVGRKQSLLICMSINGFFAFLSSFVQGYGFFLFCRLLSGFG